MELNEYIAADSVEMAYDLLNKNQKNHLIAGGAWIKISLKNVDNLIGLEKLELDFIKEANDFFEIGAMTSLRELQIHEGIKSLGSGILCEAISNIMGINIRNLATIGGSVMGKFAFSDLFAVLLVLDARLNFYKLGEISISDFLGMTKIPRDILLSIKINKENKRGYFKKVATTHLDFAIVNIAVSKGDHFKLAVGSRPGIAKSAINASNYLNSQESIDDEVITQAVAIAIEELSIGSNLRATSDYRKTLVKAYLKRGIKQVIK